MRPIRPVHHPIQHFIRRQPRPVPKIYFPKRPPQVLGHDPLMTPLRLPHGMKPSPFAEDPIYFGKGARLDVVNQ